MITGHFIEDGITLQVGIGKIPDAVVGTIKEAGYKDLGVQTELYGDGLMLFGKRGHCYQPQKESQSGIQHHQSDHGIAGPV